MCIRDRPLEKLLSYYVQSRFVRPKIRPYKTNKDVYKRQSLYKAPTTMQLSYQNQTNHDLANRR